MSHFSKSLSLRKQSRRKWLVYARFYVVALCLRILRTIRMCIRFWDLHQLRSFERSLFDSDIILHCPLPRPPEPRPNDQLGWILPLSVMWSSELEPGGSAMSDTRLPCGLFSTGYQKGGHIFGYLIFSSDRFGFETIQFSCTLRAGLS